MENLFTNTENTECTMKKKEYDKDIEGLITQLKEFGSENYFFEDVYPIARGGYYPAIKIADALGLKLLLDKNGISDYTLVVDDLSDSGSTLSEFIGKQAVAIVYNKLREKVEPQYKGDNPKPIFIGKNVTEGDWIEFPDENGTTVEDNVRRILEYIGEDANRVGLKGTPDRVVRMFKEIFRGYKEEAKPKITTFPNGEDGIIYDSMVLDEGDFYSCCEHHMMPFFGKYWFAYIPNPKGRILGISKIGRVVDYCAARLQVQERLTHDIVDMLAEALGTENPPLGIALVMRGEHLCKTMRGVKKKGIMSSSYLTGVFREDATLRAEFMKFASE